jgi:hypothetical protein
MPRTLVSALLSVLLLLTVGLPGAHAEWSISGISERFAPAVVKITALDETGRAVASGSGFFLNQRGALATSYHVLEMASRVIVRTVKGSEGYVLEITHADPASDLIIAETSHRNTLPVTLGNSDKVLVGERILIMGNSPGWEGTLSSGIITHVRMAGNLTLIQVSAPILPGCSGAPVFNISGEVIGIATAYLDTAHFVLPANSLRSLKVHRSPVSALREASVKIEASLVNDTLVELVVKEETGHFTEKAGAISSSGSPPPLTVYFKSGKRVLCDLVWKEGGTVFLVVQGKRFAVGYDLDLIDVKRSLLWSLK